jgi:hypothetical protein
LYDLRVQRFFHPLPAGRFFILYLGTPISQPLVQNARSWCGTAPVAFAIVTLLVGFPTPRLFLIPEWHLACKYFSV